MTFNMSMSVCRGAAEGEGLGNAFLSHIQAVDGIFHVCRGFEDPEVTHVEDRVDPVEDLEIIHKYDLTPSSSTYKIWLNRIFRVVPDCSSPISVSAVSCCQCITVQRS